MMMPNGKIVEQRLYMRKSWLSGIAPEDPLEIAVIVSVTEDGQMRKMESWTVDMRFTSDGSKRWEATADWELVDLGLLPICIYRHGCCWGVPVGLGPLGPREVLTPIPSSRGDYDYAPDKATGG